MKNKLVSSNEIEKAIQIKKIKMWCGARDVEEVKNDSCNLQLINRNGRKDRTCKNDKNKISAIEYVDLR